jgi:hypothetical protein
MEDNSDDTPDHPDGLPFPEDGIQAVEGPNGHQRIEGKGAEYIYAGFDELAKVVIETTYSGSGETERTYRAILQDEGGDIHLGGGGAGDDRQNWIDIDYGWEDALAAVDSFIRDSAEDTDRTTSEVVEEREVVEGKEPYQRLRAQMN